MSRTAAPALVGLLGVLLPIAAAGQVSEGEMASIVGRVLDAATRAPLEGVDVVVGDLGIRLRTDAAGEFRIPEIPVGSHRLSLSLAGYQPASGPFAVVQDGSFVTALKPLSIGDERFLGRVVGRVLDAESGDPLAGAAVQLAGLSLGGATRSDGWFQIWNVPAGRHPVEFSHLGYATVRDTIEVVADRTSDARVRLSIDPVDVEPIEVSVERRQIGLESVGFYERRNEGWGQFIDLQTIQRWNPQQVTDLFDRLTGVTLTPNPSNPVERMVVLRGGRGQNLTGAGSACYPKVWLDGVLAHPGGSTPALLDRLVNPVSVEGVEVYPSEAGVPPQWGGLNASCGVIVLWTRR